VKLGKLFYRGIRQTHHGACYAYNMKVSHVSPVMLRLLTAIMGCAILATPASADELPGPKIAWPDVKGFEKQKPNTFKDTNLGYSVSYISENLVVVVFVYNLGLKEIPVGPNSDAVKAEMYESLLALEANKKTGRYKALSPLDEGVVPFGSSKTAPQLRRKRYEIEITKEGPAFAELYVTSYKNHFIKIRATYPRDEKTKSEKAIATLLDALSQELK
jgi:hypothetical protein